MVFQMEIQVLKLTKISMFSGCENTMELPISSVDYFKWHNGESGLIQNAFPNLTPDQREFMMTGATPEEWNELFGMEDDEEYHERD